MFPLFQYFHFISTPPPPLFQCFHFISTLPIISMLPLYSNTLSFYFSASNLFQHSPFISVCAHYISACFFKPFLFISTFSPSALPFCFDTPLCFSLFPFVSHFVISKLTLPLYFGFFPIFEYSHFNLPRLSPSQSRSNNARRLQVNVQNLVIFGSPHTTLSPPHNTSSFVPVKNMKLIIQKPPYLVEN